jgi:cation diffusion facilitator CzcD-associated flavoprotein CzcO
MATNLLIPPFGVNTSAVERRLGGPLHSERHVKVICVGAGASGLLMAYKLQKHFKNYRLTVYEKNSEVSGTWFENKYPG